jgi:dihydrofolate synthase/folylpolyglutamate synthase
MPAPARSPGDTDAYLASLIPSGAPQGAYGLASIVALLDALGRPQDGGRFVHVGGTAGKGSTASILAAILTAAGYRTGLHVSPHFARLGERATVNGEPASLDRMRSLIDDVRAAAERIAVSPSYFECLWAVALLEFRARATDVNVVEVGLGGLTDATNVIASGHQILTNIGLDHVKVLGSTTQEILRVKQGIVKPGSQVVSGIGEPGLQLLLSEHAAQVGAEVAFAGVDFEAGDVRELRDASGAPRAITFTHRDGEHVLRGLELALPGRPQADNAALAVAMAHRLRPVLPALGEAAIRRGLSDCRVPGRMEIVRRDPLVIFDGAHNPEKFRWLVAGLDASYPGRRFATVVRYRERPDMWSSLALLATISARIILTASATAGDTGIEPGGGAADWARAGAEFGAIHVAGAGDALAHAIALVEAGQTDGVVVTGSIYMLQELYASGSAG